MYGLCALTSVLCAWLLLQAYRRRRIAVLFWGGLFFGIQAVNNGLLVIDKLVVPDVDYSVLRFGIALGANMLFLYGLILRSEMD
jgi:hypothetical protein